MDNKSLIVLIDLLSKEAVAKIEIPEPVMGPRGLRGRDGNDFNIEDHKESLIELIEAHSNITLTSEQIESLRGIDGKDGKSVTIEDVLPEINDAIVTRIDSIKDDLKLKFSDLTEEEKSELKGVDGKDGKSVKFEDVYTELSLELSEKILAIRDDLRLKFSDLTEEEVNSLRGQDGRDGKDGIDFDFSAHEETIVQKINHKIDSVRGDLKLKFSELTDEEKAELKGPRGQRGKPGEDFVFEENADKIRDILQNYVNEKLPELKLNFSDLSDDDIFLLKGKDGRDGRDGIDFDFEENRVEIQNQICEYIDSVKDSLKLTFNDLSDEEKDSLKMKFSELTEEERSLLKGPRGQRGKPGIDGYDGKDGATWHVGTLPEESKEGDLHLDPNTCHISQMRNGSWEKIGNIRGMKGLPGLPGLNGRDGRDGARGFDGRDGRDAPVIENVKMESFNKEFRLVFEMSDGSEHITNYIDFPATVQNIFNSYVASRGGSGGGGGTANPTQYYEDGNLIGEFQKVNFTGNGVSLVDNGDTVEVQVNYTDTNTTELKVEKDGTLITTIDDINFTGAGVTVTEVGGKAVVNIPGGGGAAAIAIEDEGVEVTPTVQRMNFIGPYVTVRQRVPISEWDTMAEVLPNMSDFMGDGSSDIVDVYIDTPDSSVLRDVNCANDVFVGAFVYIDSSEIARNAIASAYGTSNVIGLVESITGTKCNIRVSGISASIFTGLNPELDYFLSDSVAGTLSAAVPTTSGHIKLKLGQSFGSTKFLFQKGERVVRL